MSQNKPSSKVFHSNPLKRKNINEFLYTFLSTVITSIVLFAIFTINPVDVFAECCQVDFDCLVGVQECVGGAEPCSGPLEGYCVEIGGGGFDCAGELGCVSPCCYDACPVRGLYCYDVIECGWNARGKYRCITFQVCDPNHCFAACVCPPAPTASPSPSPSPVPTCTVNLVPASDTIQIGSTGSFTASVVPTDGTVDQVNFSSSNSSVASVLPATDNTPVYSTIANGNSDGSATITSDVVMSGAVRCTDTSAVTVPELLDPWWQVKDGDITTSGSIRSHVPANGVFVDDGAGGFPGIPIYANSLNTNSNPISSTSWKANTTTSLRRLFDYDHFENKVPTDVVFIDPTTTDLDSGGAEFYGYYWYKATSGLTINSDVNLGNRKVILFVEGGDFNINGKINLNDGSGFFLAISDDNILVNPSITGSPSLEGLYVTDGIFSSGDGGTDQLHIRGSVAGYGGIDLSPGRDLGGNNATPAELFEYAPDQILLFPAKLSTRKTRWNEIAP